ncbi:MAG: hypothetical protein BIFFINMI_03817 [Phycisphaerae bacterium]|nr:hypothetical protein [Phycisphaerae bacterium]
MIDAANNTNAIESRIGPDEELISLNQAARRLPRVDGRKVAISTLWRWCRAGLRGVRLEYARVGRKICTSHQALTRFMSQVAAVDDDNPPAFVRGAARRRITSKRRLRALQQADEVLARAGI